MSLPKHNLFVIWGTLVDHSVVWKTLWPLLKVFKSFCSSGRHLCLYCYTCFCSPQPFILLNHNPLSSILTMTTELLKSSILLWTSLFAADFPELSLIPSAFNSHSIHLWNPLTPLHPTCCFRQSPALSHICYSAHQPTLSVYSMAKLSGSGVTSFSKHTTSALQSMKVKSRPLSNLNNIQAADPMGVMANQFKGTVCSCTLSNV